MLWKVQHSYGQIPTNQNDDDFQRERNIDQQNPFTDSGDTIKTNEGKVLLQDDIENVYGPSTTQYVHEHTLYEMRDTLYTIDTTLHYFHRYNECAKSGYLKQNLGNLGTASKDIYTSIPKNIGTRLGFDVFDSHITNSRTIKYYNSKSPYTDWYYVDGGNSRTTVDASLSQNINPHWSAAIRYKSITSNTLVGNRVQSRNNINVSNQQFTFKTWYETQNKRYKLTSSYINAQHEVNESGGLVLDSIFINGVQEKQPIDSFLTVNNAFLSNRFSGVETVYTRVQFNLYHQFNLLKNSKRLQIFHRFSRTHQEYVYEDMSFSTNAGEYQNLLLENSSATYIERIKFQRLSNRFGFKGKIGKWFYSGYLQFSQHKQYTQFDEGNSIPLPVDPQNIFRVQSYYPVGKNAEIGGTYLQILGRQGRNLTVYFKNKYLHASYRMAVYEPNQVQSYYFSNFFRWNNTNFIDTEALALYVAGAIGKNKKLTFAPYAKFTTFNNYIYFDTLATPRQANSTQNIGYAGFHAKASTGLFRHLIHVRYASVSALMRAPGWLIVYESYLNLKIKGKLKLQPGLDIRYNSKYQAESYEPVTKQFFLQNRYMVGNFPIIDFFLNFQVNKTHFFLKVTNVLYKIPFLGTHYFATPGYMGQIRTFEFGLDWKLFD